MNKTTRKQLRVILEKLISEFSANRILLLKDTRLSYGYRTGKVVLPGHTRNSGTSRTQIATAFNFRVLAMFIGDFIKDYSSTKDLFEFVNQNKLWHTYYENYEACKNMIPSMTTQIGGGFLVRNFELNGNSFAITPTSFETSFEELVAFFRKDYIETETYINLYGPKGKIEEVKFSSNVAIIKANHDLATLFNVNYNGVQDLHTEMFEGDYVLKIKSRIPKNHFSGNLLASMTKKENDLVAKWSKLPVLSLQGVLHIGRRIKVSMDWPLVRIDAVGPYLLKPYQSTFKKDTICELDHYIESLQYSFKKIKRIDLAKLDEKVIYSIHRLTKSKEADNVNDRIIELAIAFEYLISTSTRDVSLTLKLKAIKLITDKNDNDELYKKIGAFYDLRSKIVHGNTTKVDMGKSKELIDFTEKLVQNLILRYFDLEAYSYVEIDKALTNALHINKPLINLLRRNSHR